MLFLLYACFFSLVRSYPAREKGAVLKLAQIEGDEEGSGHEHQREQGCVGLSGDRGSGGAGGAVAVAVKQLAECDVLRRAVALRAVAICDDGAPLQWVCQEYLKHEGMTSGFYRTLTENVSH